MSVAILPAVDAPIAVLALESDEAEGLAQITRPAVALVRWRRQPAVAIPAADLIALDTLRLVGDPDDAEASILSEWGTTPRHPWQAAVARDVGLLARRFAEIAGSAEVAIRLERVEGDACRRFHTDYVPLRLITTYAGRGTEWRLADDAAPVNQMAIGDVGLFKGREWGEIGLLHRSPPIMGTGERRLLLVIDAVRQDDDRGMVAG